MLRIIGTTCSGDPDASVSYTVGAGSIRVASSCAKYCITTLWPTIRSPASGGSSPESIRISVDLPAPFGPTSAMRSPRSMWSVRPPKTTRSPYALRACFSSSTIRPLLAHAGKSKWIFLRSGGTSIGTTFSSILIRLCTCDALVAW